MNYDHPSPLLKTGGIGASFGYATEGLAWVWRTQRNFRIHCVIAVAVIGLGYWVGLAPWEWAVVGLLMGGMLTTECLNTAIEATVDLICGDNPYRLAKAAKDLAAGACLLWALTSVTVGLIIFLPKMLTLLTPSTL